jgi:hypothetical protein
VRIFAVVNLLGADGPQTLAEVRTLLDIEPPGRAHFEEEAASDEKKYKFGGSE